MQCWCYMANMISVWALSFLLLDYTLGVPIFNITRSDLSGNITSDNFTQESDIFVPIRNITSHIDEFDSSFDNLTELFPGPGPGAPLLEICVFSTCIKHELDRKLQTGNEIAGRATWDPEGPGKK